MTHKPLSPDGLAQDFADRDAVRAFYDAIVARPPAAIDAWRTLYGRACGYDLRRPPKKIVLLAKHYGLSDEAPVDRLLFALHTYYAAVVQTLVGRFPELRNVDLLADDPLGWYATSERTAVRSRVDAIAQRLEAYELATMPAGIPNDLLKPLYEALFPRTVRHVLGEYYTPDWLAEHVLDQLGYTGDVQTTLLDPACGSGTFLLAALRRLRKAPPLPKGEGSNAPQADLLGSIAGYDLNPLAVLAARANCLIAVRDLITPGERVDVPVYLRDAILDPPEPAEAFDYVAGNPPWIAWDNLPADYRQATRPLWQQYGLFTLSANEARHGGGKKDLAMLMLYRSADRYLRPGGRLGMVVTQTLFQTAGAGDGFRGFRLGPDGPMLRVLRVDDFVAAKPFDNAANWTSTIVLEKGAATVYPVPYVKWGRGEKGEGRRERDARTIPRSSRTYSARPIDSARPGSPWLVLPEGTADIGRLVGPSDYTAHLGANSGGANGVYWLQVDGRAGEGVRVRNVATRGKQAVANITCVIEPDLVYPLLRWGDIQRYRARPSLHLLLAQDPATRTGIELTTMQQAYPRTHAYLQRFEPLLSARAAYRRYQGESPFYSMYNVGPYTVAPVKVVWRRMDRRINAAVVEPVDDPLLGRRPMIPQETCVLVACETADEAHYLCAVLNSALVHLLVAGHSVAGGKSFGTPGMLQYLNLRRYRPEDERHAALAALSRRAHEIAAADGDKQDTQGEIDRLVEDLWQWKVEEY